MLSHCQNFLNIVASSPINIYPIYQAIHGYRETERSSWNFENTKVINRLKETAFCDVSQPTDYVHVLDLEENGEIKPHKDSVRVRHDIHYLNWCHLIV